MKDPLTQSYFDSKVGELVSDRTKRKKLSAAFQSMEKLEKPVLKDPCNADKVKAFRAAIADVKSGLLNLKIKDLKLKKEIVTITKGLRKYCREHNTKIVDKITSYTIGSVPGGMEALLKQSKKDFSKESYDFMREVQKCKKDGTQLLALHKKYVQKINISSRTQQRYTKASGTVAWAQGEMKKKENKTNSDKRNELLKKYNDGVDELYTATQQCREEIVQMMNDAVMRMKQDIMLDET
jgi:hypothetical protein